MTNRLYLLALFSLVMLMLRVDDGAAQTFVDRSPSGKLQSLDTDLRGGGNFIRVTTDADSGAGSLRQAILDAADGDWITFDSQLMLSNIDLASNLPTIEKTLTISASGAPQLAIRGTTDVRSGFTVADGGNLTLSFLALEDGQLTSDGGGALFVSAGGSVTLDGVTISNNEALYGGAIVNNGGSLTIENSTIYNNRATSAAATHGGGAINQYGTEPTITIKYSTFSENEHIGATRDGLWAETGSLVVTASVFASNTPDLSNCTIEDGVSVASVGYNLERQLPVPSECGFLQSTDVVDQTVTMSDFANLGGNTKSTRPSASGSVEVPLDSAECGTTFFSDQRGAQRQFSCTGGAVELNTCAAKVSTETASYLSDDGSALQSALNEAAAGDTIWVNGFCAGNSMKVSDATAQYVIDKDVIIKGVTRDSATGDWGEDADIFGRAALDATFDLVSVIKVSNNANVTLENLELSKGFAFQDEGGGLLVTNGATVSLRSVIVAQNVALGQGGGIHNEFGGTLTAENVWIAYNRGIVVGGGLSNEGDLTLTGVLVGGNSSVVGGGDLYNGGEATIEKMQTEFEGSSAQRGGSIYNAGTLTLTRSAILFAQATAEGGAVYIDPQSTATTIINSVFLNNEAAGSMSGSAILAAGPATLINNTINQSFDGSIETDGDALVNAAGNALTLQNNIITGSAGSDCLNFGTLTDSFNNLVQDDGADACGLSSASNLVGVDDPLVSGVSLLADSPAINAGSDAVCPDADFLGRIRIAPCDIGAIEFVRSIYLPTVVRP